ncbi:MAG: 50S ribosomal protein L18 [Pseudomonadota bacterium]
MKDKKSSRLRRARKSRGKISRLETLRLSVHRTPRHFYAQVFDLTGEKVLASASTLDADVKSEAKSTGNCDAASVVGKVLAERAKTAGVESVAFDRSGFRYHGRVKAFADAARENGLQF